MTLTLPDADDPHVAAAAMRGRADAIVTANIWDFPDAALAPLGSAVDSPADSLLDQLDLAPRVVLDVLREQAEHMRHPPLTPTDLTLTWLPTFQGDASPRDFRQTSRSGGRAGGLPAYLRFRSSMGSTVTLLVPLRGVFKLGRGLGCEPDLTTHPPSSASRCRTLDQSSPKASRDSTRFARRSNSWFQRVRTVAGSYAAGASRLASNSAATLARSSSGSASASRRRASASAVMTTGYKGTRSNSAQPGEYHAGRRPRGDTEAEPALSTMSTYRSRTVEIAFQWRTH